MHDVWGGGLATALAEMMAVTGVGAVWRNRSHGELFSEFPGRFVVATNDAARFRRAEARACLQCAGLGRWRRVRVGATIDLSVEEIAARRDGALVEALEATS